MNEKFKTYLEKRCEEAKSKAKQLADDFREDEANMEKVRANVYEIFRTVINASEKAKPGRREAKEFFLDRLEQIPSSWQRALEAAREHDDQARAAIELIKLEAAADIKKAAELWEVE